jgi:hypothetical protein
VSKVLRYKDARTMGQTLDASDGEDGWDELSVTAVHKLLAPRSSSIAYRLNDKVGWWARQDLNLGPTDYESAALTAELQAPPY